MQGKTVVITGATSGIGEVAAMRLARQGARLLLVARDPRRAERVLTRLKIATPAAGHGVYPADLSRLSEMKRVGAEIATAEPRIDVLINNAGAFFGARRLTEDGLERTFALNHMAYFLLTCTLIDRLKAAAPSRIVSTASIAHRGAHLDFADLQGEKGYDGYKAYGRSKLCNILFTRELARRLAGTGVTANCLHPGFVATRFGDQAGGVMSLVIRAAKLFAISPEKGAETIVHLASSPDVAGSSGGYFDKCRPATPTTEARDDVAAARLWTESVRIAGIDL
ncbi:MAG TPA: SDR family oxidoreductase [Dongiaceae bacterium]|nr:SDR family oxidoreductase [Dongiaceae bacterium]